MRVSILGCGGSAGVPQLGGPDGRGDWGQCDRREPRNRRTRSSIAITGAAGTLLVDTGPDLRGQLIACGIKQVEAILYTHAHADHVGGIDDVRILNRLIGRPLDAHATQPVLDELAARFDYVFRPWQPPNFFRPVLVGRPVMPGESVPILGLPVQVIDQDHGFVRTLGLRIGDFAYCTDVVALDETAISTLRGIDTWVVGCFQRRPHRTHAHIDLVRSWADRIGPRRVVLTHMSYDLDWAWMREHLPSGMEAAFDGQILELTN